MRSIDMKSKIIGVSIATMMMLSASEHNSSTATVGASGAGDSIFALEGNGGIDVEHYALSIQWDDKSGIIDANASLDIKSTQRLSRFNLDFHDLNISSLSIDGKACSYSRDGDELIITLPSVIESGSSFGLEVLYSGKPTAVKDAITSGWGSVKAGVEAVSEPISSKNWFPCNNYPKDKATYSINITVPKAYDVVSNGTPSEPTLDGDKKTFRFQTREPMSSYLAMVAIGHYDIEKLQTKGGIPIYNYFYKGMKEELKKPFVNEAKIIDFFAERFGKYPFASAGIVATDGESILAYETQTRSLFGTPTNERMVAHEIAHQWFGDFVSLSDWRESWLKEGFATYSSALWFEHTQGKKAMDAWVKGNFESLMGIQMLPKVGLGKLLKVFETKEKMIKAKDIEILINLGTNNKTNPTEMKAALALVPADGISNFNLDEVFSKVSFESFRLTFGKYVTFMNILDEKVSNDRPFEEIVSALAEAPESVKSMAQMYSSGVYVRGALAMHALRIKVGDEKFFAILKAYFKRFGNSHAGSKEFTQLAKEVSGEDLDSFFKAWLEDKLIPDIPEYGLFKKNYSK